MCIIIVRRRGSAPVSTDYLQRAKSRNPHGYGFAYWDAKNKLVRYRKSSSMHDCIDSFRELEKANLEFIFHTRYATHGAKNDANAHPYLVDGWGLIFHNGKMSKMEEWNKSMSDTWHFTQKVKSRLKKQPWRTLHDVISHYNEKHLGESRLAAMSVKDGSILLYGEVVEEKSSNINTWVELGGNLFSNRYSINEKVVANNYTYVGKYEGSYRGSADYAGVLSKSRSRAGILWKFEEAKDRILRGSNVDIEALEAFDETQIMELLADKRLHFRVAQIIKYGSLGYHFHDLTK